MTTVDDMLFHLGGVPVLTGIPFSGESKTFFVDTELGSDSYEGTTPERAKASLLAAYNLTTSGNNDVVYFIGRATADTLSAILVWSNDYTHLIGLSSPLPGVGQRCRVNAVAAGDLTSLVTWSSDGSICSNMQFMNESDANVDSGSVVVSGHRNAFINTMVAGMGHATPAARAGSYSLGVSGVENHFKNCYIGVDTIVRAAANSELDMSGSKNSFWDCTFSSQSETAGKFHVTVSGAGVNIWKDCLFINKSTNWATTLTNVFNITASSTHHIVLQGANTAVGFTGWADVVTHVYGAGPAANAGFGIATNPTT